MSWSQTVKCAIKWRYENTECNLSKDKEVENECKVASIIRMKEKKIFQRNERDIYTKKGGDGPRLRGQNHTADSMSARPNAIT